MREATIIIKRQPGLRYRPELPADFAWLSPDAQRQAVARWLGISIAEASMLVRASDAAKYVGVVLGYVACGEWDAAQSFAAMATRSMGFAALDLAMPAGTFVGAL